MPETITTKGMQSRAERFLACQTFEQLALLLGTQPMQLIALAAHPQYREFFIPKKSGGKRLIEDPVAPLKKVQRKLNDFLQAVYHFQRTDAAYGFLTNPTDDPAPRNILSNAQVHLGCQWMLNLDMQDFFHLVSEPQVKQLFMGPLLEFNDETSTALAAICTYKGRLPMGAPTSPILSNFASIPLDKNLENYAREQGWKYTRYADDMTFSSPSPIDSQHIAAVEALIQHYDFRLNPSKIRLFGPNDDKEVTGLIVKNDAIELAEDYLDMLNGAIQQFSDIVDAQHVTPSGQNQKSPWVEELKQQVQGKLEFARHILGEESIIYRELDHKLQAASEPPEHYGPLIWLEFGYDTPK